MQKIAINIGDGQVQSGLIVHFAFIFILFLVGALRVSMFQLSIYLLTCGIALLVHSIAHHDHYSVPSLLLYLAIYIGTCFVVDIDDATYARILRHFQTVALLVSAAVGADWAFQLSGLPIPNLEAVIPTNLQLSDYAYMQPIVWGSPLIKPNGIFFPETSLVSGFLATALIIEIVMFQRIKHIVAFLTSMVATFGGSGMLLVALAAPFIVRHIRPGLLVGLVLATGVSLVVGDELGVFQNMANRSTEISNEDSSGYHRFIEPFNLIADTLSGGTAEALLGSGAGTAAKGFNIVWNPMSKAISEYGLIFGLFYLLLTGSFLFGFRRPFALGWACFVNYHLLGGGFSVPWFMVLSWIVVGGYHIRPPDAGRPEAAQPASAIRSGLGDAVAQSP